MNCSLLEDENYVTEMALKIPGRLGLTIVARCKEIASDNFKYGWTSEKRRIDAL